MKNLLLIISVLSFSVSFAQDFPKDYFQSPLDIPLFLSGNFGELRSNHFHAGLDIKTQGVEGQKVLSVADGYVSRIKVSPNGYGNAIYVTHPNGYTSVYGHLKKYNDKITEYVKENQYRKESFAIQLFPPPFKFQLKKGDLIAYSGNTGGSGGPHLHFEIRDTKTEHPHNPLFFGFDIKDNIKPDIYALTVYPMNDSSFVNGVNKTIRLKASGSNGIYKLTPNRPVLLDGEFGFGIETVDRMNGTGNKYGLHNIQLSISDQIIYEQQIDEFAFHEGRFINSHVDYKTYRKSRRRVQKSFQQPGNKLRIYKKSENNGIINVTKNEIGKYKVSDLFGNYSELQFKIEKHDFTNKPNSNLKSKAVKYFNHKERNTFVEKNLLVDLPAYVLYDDIYFEYREEEPILGSISPIYWIHNHYTPLHKHISLSIKMPPLDSKIKDKAYIFSTIDGKSKYAEGGKWNGNNITVKTRSFGGYGVAVDTLKPSIKPVNIFNGANMRGKWSISVVIKDHQSGIASYRGTVDGKWILMQYDAKNKKIAYYFDENVGPGKHLFELEIKDKVGNTKNYSASFTR
jgi:hypothetical protein